MGNSSSANSACSEVDHAPPEKSILRRGVEQKEHWYEKMRESGASQDLFDAAVRGDVKVAMSALVSHGNPNCCNADGLTPLSMAVAGGHTEIVRLLTTSGAKVNAAPGGCIFPISLAAAQGENESLCLLLQWKAETNMGARSGNAPLTCAAAAGHVQACATLLQQRADPDAHDDQGVTATMRAVEKQQLQTAELLVRAGASMVRADKRSRSALSRAIDVLLRIDALGKNANGIRNPLSEYDYWVEVCRMMVDRHANVDIIDAHGDTLLSRAVRHHRKDVLITLLFLGADRDLPVPSLDGGTALLQTVRLGDRDLCQSLVQHAASVNQPTATGVSPLMVAIDAVDEEMCFFLLQSGAQFSLRDPRTGDTLVMRAAATGLRRVYDHLRPHVVIEAVSKNDGHISAYMENGVEYDHISEYTEDD